MDDFLLMKVCHVLISRCSFCKKIKVGKDERTPGLRARPARAHAKTSSKMNAFWRARVGRARSPRPFSPRGPLSKEILFWVPFWVYVVATCGGPDGGVEGNLNRNLLGWGWIWFHLGSMLWPLDTFLGLRFVILG